MLMRAIRSQFFRSYRQLAARRRVVLINLNPYIISWRKRIGSGGAMLWPPTSPDLTAMKFSVWGSMKDSLYVRQMSNSTETQKI
jgi:hypothetical protein